MKEQLFGADRKEARSGRHAEGVDPVVSWFCNFEKKRLQLQINAMSSCPFPKPRSDVCSRQTPERSHDPHNSLFVPRRFEDRSDRPGVADQFDLFSSRVLHWEQFSMLSAPLSLDGALHATSRTTCKRGSKVFSCLHGKYIAAGANCAVTYSFGKGRCLSGSSAFSLSRIHLCESCRSE